MDALKGFAIKWREDEEVSLAGPWARVRRKRFLRQGFALERAPTLIEARRQFVTRRPNREIMRIGLAPTTATTPRRVTPPKETQQRQVDMADVRNFGGDIYAANDYADANGLPVYAPPGLPWVLPSTLKIRWGLIGGGRLGQWTTVGQTMFVPGTPGMNMIHLTGDGGQAILDNFCVEGENTAAVGMLYGDRKNAGGGQTVSRDIRVLHCKKGIVAATHQNAAWFNCASYYNAANWVFANGARNCNLYNCNAATYIHFEWDDANGPNPYYDEVAMGIPKEDTANILFTIDPTSPDYDGPDAFVTMNGNDHNTFFGGIYEGAQAGLKFTMENYDGPEPISSLATFYDCDMSNGTLIDNPRNKNIGVVHFDDGVSGVESQTSNYTKGNKGFIHFSGKPMFLGGNQSPGRGFTVPNNYKNLITLDSDLYEVGKAGQWDALREADVIMHPQTHVFKVTDKGYSGASNGVVFYPLNTQNVAPNDSLKFIGGPYGFNAVVMFTIKEIEGDNPVLVMIAQAGPPWERMFASVSVPDTYQYYVRYSGEDLFSLQLVTNENKSFSVVGITVNPI